jgi:uncharacterized protein YoxC
MKFDDQFIERLTADPVNTILEACNSTLASVDFRSGASKVTVGQQATEGNLERLEDCYALIVESCQLGLISIGTVELKPSWNAGDNYSHLCDAITRAKEQLAQHSVQQKIDATRKKLRRLLDRENLFEFTQGDFDRIQVLLNELRSLVSKATQLTQDHRQRLLKRLERLQTELHKKVSDLDRIWGICADLGMAARKLGENAKPIVDRIRELGLIAGQTQAHAEELPSSSPPPLLIQSSANQEDDNAKS